LSWGPLAGGWLSGQYGKDKSNVSMRVQRQPSRYDLSVPANQRKLEIVTELATLAEQAGLSLIELALAFVLEHPAISAAIIGPRTVEHLESQLSASDIELETSVLDRIDDLVAPGTNVNPRDDGWSPSVLAHTHLRRHYR
jgi:aryl-alcohol dehydrogenase-like predicted oxidoreductase